MTMIADAQTVPRSERLATLLQQAVYAGRLLLDRRVLLFAAGDAFFLFVGLLEAIDAMGGGDWLDRLYPRVVVAPMLVLGLPAMSGVVALERRAGSLDLALAVPSTVGYFRRRIAPICALMAVQGWVVLWLAADGWELLRALYQSTALAAFLGALVLFWAVRLATSGAVLVASLGTVAVLSPWIFFSPVTRLPVGAPPDVMGIPLAVIGWCWKAAVLTGASVILWFYARVRLERPESMLV